MSIQKVHYLVIALMGKICHTRCNIFSIDVLTKERFFDFLLEVNKLIFLIDLTMNIAVEIAARVKVLRKIVYY